MYWNVPLSCVPPCRRFCGRCALTDRLWNCSVDRPLFMLTSWFGTRLSRLLQKAMSAAFRPRVSHLRRDVGKLAVRADDAAVGAGDELQRLAGNRDDRVLVGMDPSAVGSPSCVRSLQVAPPSVDSSQRGRWTAVQLAVRERAAEVDDVGRAGGV